LCLKPIDTFREGTELKAEHSILKVYRHESGPEQQRLQLSHEDQNRGE